MVGANNYFGANDFVQKQQINNQKVVYRTRGLLEDYLI